MSEPLQNELEPLSSAKKRCLLVFLSVHQVMKAEKLLKHQGVNVDLIPLPREISSDCGVAIELPVAMMEEALGFLKQNGLSIHGCYTKNHRTYEKKDL